MSNERDGPIQGIDTRADRVTLTAWVADRPRGSTSPPAAGTASRSSTRAMRVIANLPAGVRVWGVALTRDGRKLYAANSLSNTVSVIDTKTLQVVKTIKTGDGPWALAVR